MLRLFTQPGKNLYAIVELRGKPYYIAPNDILITASLKSLAPGDTLSLDRVREIGSSTHILKGNPYIKPEFFKIEATVMDHSKSAEIEKMKKMKRGKNRIVKNTTAHTSLRIKWITLLHEAMEKGSHVPGVEVVDAATEIEKQ